MYIDPVENTKRGMTLTKSILTLMSNGKFILLSSKDYIEYMQELVWRGKILGMQDIENPKDIPISRSLADETLKKELKSLKERKKIQLIVSEGASNILKHATKGKLIIIKKDKQIKLIFCDIGKGMFIEKLPFYVFYGGSTFELSLGVGFSIMIAYSNRVLLYTTKYGTAVILEKEV